MSISLHTKVFGKILFKKNTTLQWRSRVGVVGVATPFGTAAKASAVG